MKTRAGMRPKVYKGVEIQFVKHSDGTVKAIFISRGSVTRVSGKSKVEVMEKVKKMLDKHKRFVALKKIGRKKAESYAKYYNEEVEAIINCWDFDRVTKSIPSGARKRTVSPIFIYSVGRIFHESAPGFCKGNICYIDKEMYNELSM